MKAHLIDAHLLVPRSRSSAKVKVKYQDHVSQKSGCGVRGREVEQRPCNHEVPCSSPGSGSQLWDISLAHTFCASTGVVPRKQNRERLI